jgi:hypothetical protein
MAHLSLEEIGESRCHGAGASLVAARYISSGCRAASEREAESCSPPGPRERRHWRGSRLVAASGNSAVLRDVRDAHLISSQTDWARKEP